MGKLPMGAFFPNAAVNELNCSLLWRDFLLFPFVSLALKLEEHLYNKAHTWLGNADLCPTVPCEVWVLMIGVLENIKEVPHDFLERIQHRAELEAFFWLSVMRKTRLPWGAPCQICIELSELVQSLWQPHAWIGSKSFHVTRQKRAPMPSRFTLPLEEVTAQAGARLDGKQNPRKGKIVCFHLKCKILMRQLVYN